MGNALIVKIWSKTLLITKHCSITLTLITGAGVSAVHCWLCPWDHREALVVSPGELCQLYAGAKRGSLHRSTYAHSPSRETPKWAPIYNHCGFFYLSHIGYTKTKEAVLLMCRTLHKTLPFLLHLTFPTLSSRAKAMNWKWSGFLGDISQRDFVLELTSWSVGEEYYVGRRESISLLKY